MSDKEEIEQFKREIKSVRYWSKKIMELTMDIEQVDLQVENLKQQKNKCLWGHNLNTPYINQLLELKSQLEKIRSWFIDQILYVEKIFDDIENKADKQMIMELYLLNQKYANVAIKYNYAESTMFDRVNRAILKTIKRREIIQFYIGTYD